MRGPLSGSPRATMDCGHLRMPFVNRVSIDNAHPPSFPQGRLYRIENVSACRSLHVWFVMHARESAFVRCFLTGRGLCRLTMRSRRGREGRHWSRTWLWTRSSPPPAPSRSQLAPRSTAARRSPPACTCRSSCRCSTQHLPAPLPALRRASVRSRRPLLRLRRRRRRITCCGCRSRPRQRAAPPRFCVCRRSRRWRQ